MIGSRKDSSARICGTASGAPLSKVYAASPVGVAIVFCLSERDRVTYGVSAQSRGVDRVAGGGPVAAMLTIASSGPGSLRASAVGRS